MNAIDKPQAGGLSVASVMQTHLFGCLRVVALWLHVAGQAVAADSSRVGPADIDLHYCLSVTQHQAAADESRCPGFISAMSDDIRSCGELDGTVVAAPQPTLYRIDIDGDGRPEYLYSLDANFSCRGNESLFGCGSAPCAWTLYRNEAAPGQPSSWRAIGDFWGEHLSVVSPKQHPHFPDLRGSCEEADCDSQLYRWRGTRYQAVERVLRGIRITLFDESNLVTIRHKVIVHAQPQENSPSMGEYDDATLVVFGSIPGTDYVVVSPCRACESGFVRRGALNDQRSR